MSINVSENKRKLGNLNQIVKSILDEYDSNQAFLELEFTETAIMSDPEMAQKELDAIHQLGLKISVDDFGTGLSSLTTTDPAGPRRHRLAAWAAVRALHPSGP